MRLLENTIFEVKRLMSINPDAKLSAKLVKFAAEQSVLA